MIDIDLSPSQQAILDQSLEHQSSLILSGPGSGKTRVLTRRIAQLATIHSPECFWMVTFTNQATKEMQGRVLRAVSRPFSTVWISTFHAGFSRILREHGHHIGIDRFTIIAEETTAKYLKQLLEELTGEASEWQLKSLIRTISFCKEGMISPYEYELTCSSEQDYLHHQIYALYEDKLKDKKQLDFGDLQVNAVKLLESHPEVLDEYRHIKYLMVDEFQDINHTQLKFLKLFAKGKNLCVVGDLDQSIFAFRGSNPQYALSFEKQFEDPIVLNMDESHRCTANIANCANDLIANNTNRIPKTIVTHRPPGMPLYVLASKNESEERYLLITLIHRMLQKSSRLSDFAFLTRTNEQIGYLQDIMDHAAIPYYTANTLDFWDTKEGRMLHHLLSIASGKASHKAYKKMIIGYPRVGRKTFAKLQDKIDRGQPWEEVIAELSSSKTFPQPSAKMIQTFMRDIETEDLDVFCQIIYKWFDDTKFLKDNHDSQKKIEVRRENVLLGVKEFVSFVKQQSLPWRDAIPSFLDQENIGRDAVALLTIHSAKGLEFNTVFIPALEDGRIPSSHAQTKEEIEEERRLLYVGITRAKEHVFFTHTKYRHGKDAYPSPFLHEIYNHLRLIKKEDLLDTQTTQGTRTVNM